MTEYKYWVPTAPDTTKVPNKFETVLAGYSKRMELLRTIIGVVVLCIQIIILHHLLTK